MVYSAIILARGGSLKGILAPMLRPLFVYRFLDSGEQGIRIRISGFGLRSRGTVLLGIG